MTTASLKLTGSVAFALKHINYLIINLRVTTRSNIEVNYKIRVIKSKRRVKQIK
jgi:hypothetical protein